MSTHPRSVRARLTQELVFGKSDAVCDEEPALLQSCYPAHLAQELVSWQV